MSGDKKPVYSIALRGVDETTAREAAEYLTGALDLHPVHGAVAYEVDAENAVRLEFECDFLRQDIANKEEVIKELEWEISRLRRNV